jgi:methanogenic corrinoid protein MtbC1
MPEPLLTRYMQPLLAGRRAECFELIQDALRAGMDPEGLACDVIWPAMAQIDRLYREDRINTITERMAARINRTLADQVQGCLPKRPRRGRKLMISCASSEHEELGAQVVADLLQADGWEVYFLGGSAPHDEIVSLLGQVRPYAYVVVGADPHAVPELRSLIERIRELNACPSMNVVVTGGVFVRADGLWREVGADVCAETARDVLRLVNELPPRDPTVRVTGLVKRRRRKRRVAGGMEIATVATA